MKRKNLKKIALNKRSISSLVEEEVKGGKITTVIINVPPPTTFCSTWYANTRNDYSCQCRIA